MKAHTRAVVIGGGILGCSMLYFLTQRGWRDVVLVEKGELTSGATWHAAGQVPYYSDRLLYSRIQKESFEFYQALERETGRPVGLHACGSLRLALIPEQMREYEGFASRARHIGMDCDIIGPQQAQSLFPFLKTDEVIGALHILHDGYVDPTMSTNAIAAAARDAGAEIYRHTRVEGLARTPGGAWRVETEKGSIECEVVVNCAGFWAPEISGMIGHTLPVVAFEDEYLVTDTEPDLAALDTELPILRDMGTPFYMRQEGDGLLVSCYEEEPLFWGVDGIPRDFGMDLLPPDLDRAQDKLERTTELVPTLGEVGVKTIVNGPIPRSADLEPLIGPAHGLPGYWVLCGALGGFLQSGTAKYLAEWITEGEPGLDLSPFDVRRFGPYADKPYAVSRLAAGHIYSLPLYFPHTEPAGGRGIKTAPIHERLAARGAVFGQRNGWEVPNWFAPEGMEPVEEPSLDRANWFAPVGAECRAVRDAVGVLDMTSLAKFEVSGADAAAWLDGLGAGRLPAVGRVGIVPLLTPKGRVAAAPALARSDDGRFQLMSPATDEQRDEDWLRDHLPAEGVTFANVTAERAVLVLAGPKARDLLAALTVVPLDNGGFPWFAAREIAVAGVEVLALRMSLTGELGWELHHAAGDQVRLHDALREAGEGLGLVDFGLRALESMRLEKGWRRAGLDYGLAATPEEAGLDLFIEPEKGDFLGRDAFLAARAEGNAERLVSLRIDVGDDDADPWAEEAVFRNGTEIARATSGGHGHRVGHPIALARLPAAHAAPGTALEVEIMDRRYPAEVIDGAAYDPAGERMRA